MLVSYAVSVSVKVKAGNGWDMQRLLRTFKWCVSGDVQAEEVKWPSYEDFCY